MSKITYIDEVDVKNKTVLLRVDLNVSLTDDKLSIADDARIKQALPTINFLQKNKNQLILISHLGRPKGKDQKLSLKIVTNRLQEYLPNFKVVLINDFLNLQDKTKIKNQKENEVLVLENIRFYPKEKDYSTIFAKQLSSLADIYVNDAFAVCHRSDTSVIGPPKFLPSYGGLLLKKELTTISQVINKPERPIITIIGGAKVSTKVGILEKLIKISDHLLIGGGLANAFLCAQGYEIGNSFCEYETVQQARKLLSLSKESRALIVLPVDAIVSTTKEGQDSEVVKIENIPPTKSIFDIGPETKAKFGAIISKAKTIIWNGPMGYFENPVFKQGTDFIYYSIAQNTQTTSVVGGGDTLAAISKKEYLDKITHISTGGGAMLELIEKGTLPGIEALKK